MSSPSYETLSVLGVGVGGVLNQQPPMRVCRGCPVHSAGSPNPGPPPPLAAAPPRPAGAVKPAEPAGQEEQGVCQHRNGIWVHNAIAGIPGQQGE